MLRTRDGFDLALTASTPAHRIPPQTRYVPDLAHPERPEIRLCDLSDGEVESGARASAEAVYSLVMGTMAQGNPIDIETAEEAINQSCKGLYVSTLFEAKRRGLCQPSQSN